MFSLKRMLVSGVLVGVLLGSTNADLRPLSSTGRRLFLPSSPWNTVLRKGVRYSYLDDPRTRALLQGDARINAGRWSHPVYQATRGDTLYNVIDLENRRTITFPVPATARPDPQSDGHMYVISANGRQVLEMIGVKLDGLVITAHRAALVDLFGPGIHVDPTSQFPGVRASDASGLGGLLLSREISAAKIEHALTFALPAQYLKHGPVWPSSREDYWGFRQYRGSVPIGSLVAIPKGLDLTKLQLSPAGRALARALQQYGAYCSDQAGESGIVIYAEGAAEANPKLQRLRNDFNVLRPLLRVVTNNEPRPKTAAQVNRDNAVLRKAPPLEYFWSPERRAHGYGKQ